MGALAGAQAPAAPLPCLKEGNRGNGRTGELRGNAAKTAAALDANIQAFIEHWTYENCVLVTITNKKPLIGRDACSLAWRNLKRGVIDKRYPNYIRVPERHQNKGQHSHILTHLGVDVRSSFCFAGHTEARKAYAKWRTSQLQDDLQFGRRCTKLYSESAHPVLKAEWSFWRKLAAKGSYGVGRVEVIPIRETGKRLGRYLGKYLTKAFDGRSLEDHGSKLVSYGKQSRWWSSRFTWYSPASNLRRAKLARIAYLLSLDQKTRLSSYEDLKFVLGKQWARSLSDLLPRLLLPLGEYASCLSLNAMVRHWERDRAFYSHFESDAEAIEASTEWVLAQLWAINREYGKTSEHFLNAPLPFSAFGEGNLKEEKTVQLTWERQADGVTA